MIDTALAVAIILVAIIIAITLRTRTRQYVVEGMIVNIMARDSASRELARDLMYECDRRMVTFLDALRRKHKIGATDADCAGTGCRGDLGVDRAQRAAAAALLRGFNYEVIYEHAPSGGRDVAYSTDKGREIMLCLRENGGRPVDLNTLMFVVIHEAAHIANFTEWDHGARYWRVFKYLLSEAVAAGVYAPEDYARAPREYCGFYLDHNPYYDATIGMLNERDDIAMAGSAFAAMG